MVGGSLKAERASVKPAGLIPEDSWPPHSPQPKPFGTETSGLNAADCFYSLVRATQPLKAGFRYFPSACLLFLKLSTTIHGAQASQCSLSTLEAKCTLNQTN